MDLKLAMAVLVTIASTTGHPGMGPPGRGGPGMGYPVSSGPGAQCMKCEAELKDTKTSLREAEAKTNDVQDELADTKKELAGAKKSVAAAKQNSTKIQAELEQTRNKLKNETFEIIKYKYQMAVIEAEYGLADAGGYVRYNTSTPEPNVYGVLVCQDIEFDISCEDGEKLKLLWANYGRLRKATCDYEPEFKTNSCTTPDSVDIVTKTCDLDDSAQSCVFTPGSTMFPDDPCPGVQKNLEAVFECVKK